MYCKGPDVRLWRPSGVPWSPRLCALFCVAGARLSAPSGVPWSPHLCALFCVAGARLSALQGPSGVPWSPRLCALFCVAGARLSALEGACCTSLASLWRPVVSAPLYAILRGRRATFCSARGVMYASGVPLASRGLRTSVLYFAWQAHDFLLCKGRDVRLWRPSGVPWSPRLCALFCVASARLLLCKGPDVRLWRPSGVPWSPHLCALFCVAGARLSALARDFL